MHNLSKEFIFSLYLKFNSVIEKMLGIDVVELVLEKNFLGRKIDLYGIIRNTDKEVYIENQITRTDRTHFEQINFIIRHAKSNSVVIWIAERFGSNFLEEIEKEIKSSNKNIEFIAIEARDIANSLEIFDTLTEIEIIDNLSLLDEQYRIEIVSRFFRKVDFTEVCDINDMEEIEVSDKQQIMEEIVEEIRRKIYYLPAVHRERLLDANKITIGSGISGVSYTCGVNKYDEIFCELRFDEDKRKIFKELLGKKNEIDLFFDYLIDWNEKYFKIYSRTRYDNKERYRQIKRQILILERIIIFFTNYKRELYNNFSEENIELSNIE